MASSWLDPLLTAALHILGEAEAVLRWVQAVGSRCGAPTSLPVPGLDLGQVVEKRGAYSWTPCVRLRKLRR